MNTGDFENLISPWQWCGMEYANLDEAWAS